jgi:phage tail sheath protein FI
MVIWRDDRSTSKEGAVATYLAPGVYVKEEPSAVRPIAGVGTSTAAFIGVVPDTVKVPRKENPAYDPTKPVSETNMPSIDDTITLTAAAGEVLLCTTFSEFTNAFGDFSTDTGHRMLAHAVYGFFNNGGTRAYVVRETSEGNIASSALAKLAAIDAVAIVAAPGIVTAAVRSAISDHCQAAEDRFAILDVQQTLEKNGVFDPTALDKAGVLPANSDFAATYVPWLQVYDPATKLTVPGSDGTIAVPPSGHVAGIYARVDALRGVHKAPANEVVRGALGLRTAISRAQQESLNPRGVNAIRELNGNIRVWGARTIGGDANVDLRYVNVRRLLLFVRESIDEGMQWVVFEPNDSTLWARITRNVTAFLTNVWREGALLGQTPAEAFYVKCDAETNPPSVRDAGQVVTEIGVAIVRPAEFVVFKISQWQAPAR